MKSLIASIVLFLACFTAGAQSFTVPTTQGNNVWLGNNSFLLGQLILGSGSQSCPTSPAQEFMTGVTSTFIPICLAPPSQGTLAALCNGFVTFSSGTNVPSAGSVEQSASCTGLNTGTGGDNILADFSGNPIGVVGFIPSTSGTLTIYKFPGSGTVNFYLVNNTGTDPITLTSDVVINYIGIGIR